MASSPSTNISRRFRTVLAAGVVLLGMFGPVLPRQARFLPVSDVAQAQTATAVATLNVVISPVTMVELAQASPPRFVASSNSGDYFLPRAIHLQVRSNVPWQVSLITSQQLRALIPERSQNGQDDENGYRVVPGPRALLFWAPEGSSSWQPLVPGESVIVTPLSPPVAQTDLHFDLLVRPAPGEQFEPGVVYQVELLVQAAQQSSI